jgi:hypothetical protein
MKLRDHPLMYCSDVPSWPPAWLWRDGSDDTKPYGEVGMLREVVLSEIEPPDRCFMIMQHMGAEYIGCFLFENSAFCRKISEILREHCGKPIHEIGDIELSHAL